MLNKFSHKHLAKTRYDLRVRHSNLQKGDRVLLKKVGFKGKHKLENKWERDPYIIESQPDTDIPVYVITPEHRRSRKETVQLITHPDDDDLGDESQNSAAIGLRSILDGLWVPCLLEHAYTSSSSSLEILTSFGSSI
jgi:hypothetical protein